VGNLLFLKPKRQFEYKEQNLDYLYHSYNKTWKNERSIEIPIALHELEKYKGKRVLEVGNVLKHYTEVNHEVLDKYEPGEGIIHEDIVDFNHSEYDFIISISTMEHVGIDDKPVNPYKTIVALQKMQNMLKEDGKIFISFPMDYNSALTSLSGISALLNNNLTCFKKVDNKKNIWEEVSYTKVRDIPYQQPVQAVAFLEISKGDDICII
jgi:hypothetical protein